MTLKTFTQELLSWEGVSEHPHKFGGVEFRYKEKELGHLHGESLADLRFPKSMKDELIQAKLAEPHHIYPNSGWVTVRIKGEEDLLRLIQIFRIQYDRLKKAESE